MKGDTGNAERSGASASAIVTMGVLAAMMHILAALMPCCGSVVSALATLPIALAASFGLVSGSVAAGIAYAIVFTVAPMEAPILAFATGPLGVAVGWTSVLPMATWFRIIICGGALSLGMMTMCSLLAMAPLGRLGSGLRFLPTVLIYLALSCAYSWIWVITFPRVSLRIKSAMRLG